jgi:Cupin domain
MAVSPRRIVTGHEKNGKSIVFTDGHPPNALKMPERDVAFFEIWNTSSSPAPIAAMEAEPTGGPFQLEPQPHGTVIRIVDFLPSISKKDSGTEPFVHRTETVDYGIVLEGEVFLLLDDSETLLKAGDIVVQRGTLHAWENRSDKLARVAFVLVHGAFSAELKASLPAGALENVTRGPLGPAES